MTDKFSSKRPLTVKEEREIQKMIAEDVDNPELTDEQIEAARPFAEIFPGLAKSMEQEIAKRGRPRIENPKEAVTLRLDPETVAFFKNRSGAWRKDMAALLEAARERRGRRRGRVRPISRKIRAS